ncbi:MAG: hypothetical protein RBT65_09850 [Methanolobus sp.]|nr:hypothetical protein [Methanolobus sp.]
MKHLQLDHNGNPNYFLIEVSITEPHGSSISDNISQTIAAKQEQIA